MTKEEVWSGIERLQSYRTLPNAKIRSAKCSTINLIQAAPDTAARLNSARTTTSADESWDSIMTRRMGNKDGLLSVHSTYKLATAYPRVQDYPSTRAMNSSLSLHTSEFKGGHHTPTSGHLLGAVSNSVAAMMITLNLNKTISIASATLDCAESRTTALSALTSPTAYAGGLYHLQAPTIGTGDVSVACSGANAALSSHRWCLVCVSSIQ